MIAGKFRFHGYGALKYLFGHGKTYRFKSVSVRVVQNSRRTHSRAAVVVSKKVLKAAPGRNRVRRRVYEVLRLHWENIKPAHDILITVYDPDYASLLHEQLTHDITEALERSHLWIHPPIDPPR